MRFLAKDTSGCSYPKPFKKATMSNPKIRKYTSISELEQGDSRQPIWALNGAADSDVGQPGEVHVGIPKVNGGSKVDDLHVPQSWLPSCLTDQIPRAQLLASSEFRNAVNSKLIVLITPEFAERVLSQDGADEERARLAQMKRAVKEATGARTIQESGADVLSTETSEATRNEVVAAAKKELSPSFVMFVNSQAERPDVEVMNAIRGRGKFTSRELNHMIKKLGSKPKTLAHLNQIKAKRAAAKKAKA